METTKNNTSYLLGSSGRAYGYINSVRVLMQRKNGKVIVDLGGKTLHFKTVSEALNRLRNMASRGVND